MATPPRTVKAANGRILLLGQGSGDFALAAIAVTLQVVAATPSVSPQVLAARIAVNK